MFFIASKIFWMFLSPIAVLLMAALLGLLWRGGSSRTGRAVALGAILILIAVAMTPLGLIVAAPLENRFPQPPPDMPSPDGILILGGAINGPVSMERGRAVFDEGERVVQAAILAKRYPQARIVFTGGSGSLIDPESTEAPEAQKLLVELGVDRARITLEDKSRNTDENARFTAAILHPEPSQRWLLVTSAFHMTRSMGIFEKAGFNVIAYPVAYRTLGPGKGWPWEFDPGRGFRTFEIAIREWIGLTAYWATGRIDHIFPGPGDGAVADRSSGTQAQR
jgi:uncharacterized SAM-binding protein YcdF (DUF218 family)